MPYISAADCAEMEAQIATLRAQVETLTLDRDKARAEANVHLKALQERHNDYDHLKCDLKLEREKVLKLTREREDRSAIEPLVSALREAKRLIDVALPQFNWANSALQSDALQLLNTVPIRIHNALAPYSQEEGAVREKADG